MKLLLTAFSLILLAGCSQLQTASTTVEIPFGEGRVAKYHSTKDQTGVDINVVEIDPATQVVIKHWQVKVDKAGTPEAAYAALADQQRALADLMKALVPLIEKATGIYGR